MLSTAAFVDIWVVVFLVARLADEAK